MNVNEDIIELILRDHQPLKQLIEILRDSQKKRFVKENEFDQFAKLLLAHAKAEEKSLYIQMKELNELRMDGLEGEMEHRIAENLIHEINATPDDDQWNAKVKVLAELVEHHIGEEENEMFVNVKSQMNLATRILISTVYSRIKTDLEKLDRPTEPKRSGENFYVYN